MEVGGKGRDLPDECQTASYAPVQKVFYHCDVLTQKAE